MKKPLAIFRCLPGRGWLAAMLILLLLYGVIRLSRYEGSVEAMAGTGESLPPQSFFDAVCRLWEG